MNRFIQKVNLKLKIDHSEDDTERIKYDKKTERKTFQFQTQLTNTLNQ